MSTAPRLEQARNIWLATVRPDGRPHLVPIWFVFDADRFYICTSVQSVKARNVLGNPRVSLSLEDGDNPYLIEGTARFVTPTPSVVDKFKQKFDWDITHDPGYDAVIEITIEKQVMG